MSARKKRRTSSDPTGQFDLVVVGCGGGHDETNLSGYLCKPRDQPWDAGILGLEAGSGYGALKRLLGTTHPHLFASLFPKPTTARCKSKTTISATDKAYTVYTHLRAFLLTHAHLDHAASLVISAGSLPGPTKYILGAQAVLDDLTRCIFTPGRCWPNIIGWEDGHTNTSGGKMRALPVAVSSSGSCEYDEKGRDEEYVDLGVGMDRVRVRVVPLAHGGSCAGPEHDDGSGIYRSSAFFVRHTPTQHEFLFFGDVEADPDPSPPLTPPLSHPSPTPTLTPSSTLDTLPLSTTPPTLSASILPPPVDPTPTPCTRPLLLPIWQHTAHLFTSSHLHTLLLECSWPAGHPTARLFGHLGVEQVRKEMRALAAEVVKIKRRKPVSESTKRSKSLIPERNIPPPTRSRSKESLVPSITTTLTRSLKRKATHLPPISSDPLAGALTGLRVIIIHCKEPSPGFDLAGAPTIADYIVRQLQHGVSHLGIGPNELGVEYVAAHQGDEFVL